MPISQDDSSYTSVRFTLNPNDQNTILSNLDICSYIKPN